MSLFAGWVNDRNLKTYIFYSDTQGYEIYDSLREKFKANLYEMEIK